MTTPRKKFKYVVDNKLRGKYGETDFEKKVVRINKKAHAKDGEHLGKTIYHESLHAKFPSMTEKEVRRREKNWHKLPAKKKRALYRLINK